MKAGVRAVPAKPDKRSLNGFKSTTPVKAWVSIHSSLAFTDRNEIVLFHAPGYSQADLVHEMVHLCLAKAFHASFPEWLQEGLAEYVAMQDMEERFFADPEGPGEHGHGRAHLKVLTEALDRGDSALSLTDLLRTERLSGHQAGLYYAASWSLVTYLATRDPAAAKGNLAEFVSALSQEKHLETPQKAFERVFGSVQSVQENWFRFVRSLKDESVRNQVVHGRTSE